MAQSASNIVVGGPCKVYIAAHSTSALESAPANSVAYGTSWGGGWVEVGYTKGGAVLKPETEHLNIETDQVNAAVADFITKQGATITFAASEGTLTNIKQALGYGTITTGSTESTLGVSGTDGFPTYYTIGIEGYAPEATASSAKYRRIIGWKALPKTELELAVKKDEEQMVAYTFELRYEPQATSTERVYKIIDREV